MTVRGLQNQRNNQVLFLLDGLTIHTPFKGSPVSQFLKTVNNIKRVEVIRGPGSAVYGADAFGGVVNIVTKDGNDIDGTTFGTRAGTSNTYHAWANHGGLYSGWEIALTGEYQTTKGDGDRVVPSDQQSVLDGIFNTSASLSPGRLNTDYEVIDLHLSFKKNHWDINFWLNDKPNQGTGGGFANALDPTGNIETTNILSDLQYNTLDDLGDWNLNFRASFNYTDEPVETTLFPADATLLVQPSGNLGPGPGAVPVNFPDGVQGSPGRLMLKPSFEFTGIYTGLEDHRIRLSTRYQYEESNSYEIKNFGPGVTPTVSTVTTETPFVWFRDNNRHIYSLSLQDEWDISQRWNLTTGIRIDDYSDFGSTINPRVALLWNTTNALTLKLLYSSAFRPPTTTDQFTTNNPVSLGNPDLDPEKIDTVEFGMTFTPSTRMSYGANFFYYYADDLIEFVPDGAGVFMAENAREQEAYGLEYEMTWQPINSLNLSGNIAWIMTNDQATDKKVVDVPHLDAFVAADWNPAPGWFAYVQANYIANRNRATNDTRNDIANDTLVDLKLEKRKIINNFNAAILVKNAFNNDARYPSAFNMFGVYSGDFPLSDRSFLAELSFDLD